ncbi:MAG: NifB/NifX family molybdenum-iron cluster-binding protein [Butyricicoccus sp.]|nr:NifB/NifX family molybdenum-iron cluster-binding protein [Butyricicoccus sp.]
MTIAVTYENGQVFQHFGHSEYFKLYEVENGRVTASRVVDTNGSGHGALAGLLAGQRVDMLICGGIGPGAQNALAQAGITLCAGVSGSADEAVDAYLAGTLSYSAAANCDHHGGHHHNQCGESSCGHSCH